MEHKNHLRDNSFAVRNARSEKSGASSKKSVPERERERSPDVRGASRAANEQARSNARCRRAWS